MWGDMGRYGEIAAARLEVEAARRVEAGHLWGTVPRCRGRVPRENGPTAAPLARSYPGNISWATRRVRAMKYVAPLA